MLVRLWIVFAACLVLSAVAVAEERFALLVGNEDYPAEVGRLSNPHEDVDRVAAALRSAGFTDVEVLKDATQTDMNAGVLSLARKLRAAGSDGVGFFYYSGHGGSTETVGVRRNYMLPSKSPITSAEELTILGIPVDNVVDTLVATDAKAVFVISDACRNTLPITSTKGGETDKSFVPTQTRSGLYVAYSTADGATARDDGIFSQALAREITRPGQYVSRAFTLALREVARQRPGNKLPFSVDGLTEDLCFMSCPGEGSRITTRSEDERDWERLSALNKEEGYRIYLALHPAGSYVSAANAAIERLVSSGGAERDVETEGSANIENVASSAKAALDAANTAYYAEDYSEAATQYDIACRGGLAGGCANLGLLYDRGWGVSRDYAVAIESYRKACDGGEAWACSNYGVMYESGKGIAADSGAAVRLYDRACEMSDYQCTYLAFMYDNGKGVATDYSKAMDLYTRGCEAGDGRGCTYRGLLKENGQGVTSDFAAAVEDYRSGCELEDKFCTYLGYMYEYGRGVTKSLSSARDYYDRGCVAEDARGCSRLGYIYKDGRGVSVNYEEAMDLFDIACELDAYYCVDIGLMHEGGRGVKKDEATAAVFYEQACQANEERCTYLGYMYRYSRGRSEDLVYAMSLFERSCGAEDARACSYLGRMHQDGEGVPSDNARARSYYVTACELDYFYCNDLAYFYEMGYGGPQDYVQAAKYYGFACDDGEAIACKNLALAYRAGRGVDVSSKLDAQYSERACELDSDYCD